MKKIMVLGGTGQIGTRVVNQLLAKGYIVYPASRSADKFFSKTDKLIPVKLDVLSDQSVLNSLVKDAGVDGIIDTFGVVDSNALRIEKVGHINFIKAVQANNIKRYVKLSGVGIENPNSRASHDYGRMGLTESIEGMRAADNYLSKDSHLDWTIVEGTNFSSAKPTNKIKLSSNSDDVYPGSISMDDLANIMITCFEEDNMINKLIAVANGSTPIADALKKF